MDPPCSFTCAVFVPRAGTHGLQSKATPHRGRPLAGSSGTHVLRVSIIASGPELECDPRPNVCMTRSALLAAEAAAPAVPHVGDGGPS